MSEERFYELFDQARSFLQADQPDPARALCDQLFAIQDVPGHLKSQAEALLKQIESHPAYTGFYADAEDTVLDGDFGFPDFGSEDAFDAFDDEMVTNEAGGGGAGLDETTVDPAEPADDDDEEELDALDPNEALAMMEQGMGAEPVDPFAETQYGSVGADEVRDEVDPGLLSEDGSEDPEPVDPFADLDEGEAAEDAEWDAVADTVVGETPPDPSEAFGLEDDDYEDDEEESSLDAASAADHDINGHVVSPSEVNGEGEELRAGGAGADAPYEASPIGSAEPEESILIGMHEVRDTKGYEHSQVSASDDDLLKMRERDDFPQTQEIPEDELRAGLDDLDEPEPELPLDEEEEFVPVVVQKTEQQLAEEAAAAEPMLATKEEEPAVEEEVEPDQEEAAQRDFRMYELLARLRGAGASPESAATNGAKSSVAAKGKVALAGIGVEDAYVGTPRRTSRLSDLFASLTLALHPYKMMFVALSLLLAVAVFAGLVVAAEAQRSGSIDTLLAQGLSLVAVFVLYGLLAAIPTGIAHQTRAQLEGRLVPGPLRTTRFVWDHASVALVWPFVVVGLFGGALFALNAFGGLGAVGAEALPLLYVLVLVLSIVGVILLIGFYLPSAIIGMGRATQLTTLSQRFFRLFVHSFGHVLLYTLVVIVLTALAAALFVGLHYGIALIFDQSFAQGDAAWSASWPAEVVGALHQLVIWFPPLYDGFVSSGLLEPLTGAPALSPATVSIAIAYLVVAAVLLAYVLGTFFTGGTIAYAMLRRRQRKRSLAES